MQTYAKPTELDASSDSRKLLLKGLCIMGKKGKDGKGRSKEYECRAGRLGFHARVCPRHRPAAGCCLE